MSEVTKEIEKGWILIPQRNSFLVLIFLRTSVPIPKIVREGTDCDAEQQTQSRHNKQSSMRDKGKENIQMTSIETATEVGKR